MTTILSRADHRYVPLGHIKKLCEVPTCVTGGSQHANGGYVRASQSAQVTFLSSVLVSAFCNLIVRVYLRRSEKQMFWVAALSIITSVKNMLIGSKAYAMRKFVGYSVSPKVLPLFRDSSVSCFVQSASPFVTGILPSARIYPLQHSTSERRWFHGPIGVHTLAGAKLARLRKRFCEFTSTHFAAFGYPSGSHANPIS